MLFETTPPLTMEFLPPIATTVLSLSALPSVAFGVLKPPSSVVLTLPSAATARSAHFANCSNAGWKIVMRREQGQPDSCSHVLSQQRASAIIATNTVCLLAEISVDAEGKHRLDYRYRVDATGVGGRREVMSTILRLEFCRWRTHF